MRSRWTVLLAVAGVAALATPSPAYGSSHEVEGWSAPVNIESVPGTDPDVNTPFSDGCPIQDPHGTTLYMATNRPGGLGGLDIWVAHRQTRHDPWGPPENLGAPINSSFDDFCPTPTKGRTFFFVSSRPGGCGVHPTGDIYMSRRGPDGYAEPVHLGCEVNSPGGEASPSFVREGSDKVLYFSSTRGDGFAPELPVDADIWRTVQRQDGTFGPPELVAGVNTAADDTRPNVRLDGLEMVFDSARVGTLGGPDIYATTRAAVDEPWGEPVNLGPTVNSPFAETRASLSRDGSVLLFGSNRPGSEIGPDGVTRSNDIYQSVRGTS